MTTERQKKAVAFCNEWLGIEFDGDINNFDEVSLFLTMHLEYAKEMAEDAMASYYSNFDY